MLILSDTDVAIVVGKFLILLSIVYQYIMPCSYSIPRVNSFRKTEMYSFHMQAGATSDPTSLPLKKHGIFKF